jgi:glycerate dehydrogenase
MKIVALDAQALNQGDISWETIEAFGELEVYDDTKPDLVVERCKGARIVLTNKVPLTRKIIEKLPDLQLVQVTATGYNHMDVDAAREKGVLVCNVPSYGTASVAQHTLALMLELTNHVGMHARSVSEGEWQRRGTWCYMSAPIVELQGKTIGIVGFGNIGQEVAAIAAAFGMKVLYHSPTKKNTSLGDYAPLQSLFLKSDFISLHCPLTPQNEGFVNSALLSFMKNSAFLINTARGRLINEADLANALNKKQIAGAALDVLTNEPPTGDSPLFSARNCIITPHNAWMSKEARLRMLDIIHENLQAYLAGKPVNVVNY